jgi:hypothetical protein
MFFSSDIDTIAVSGSSKNPGKFLNTLPLFAPRPFGPAPLFAKGLRGAGRTGEGFDFGGRSAAKLQFLVAGRYRLFVPNTRPPGDCLTEEFNEY